MISYHPTCSSPSTPPPGRHTYQPTPQHVPINLPIGQGQYSNGQSFPANAKRKTTRVRKRPMKGNSVVPGMSRVMLGKGKRVNAWGPEALVTWGVQFVRPLSRTQRLSRMDYVHGVGGSLRLLLVGPVRNGSTYCQGQSSIGL